MDLPLVYLVYEGNLQGFRGFVAFVFLFQRARGPEGLFTSMSTLGVYVLVGVYSFLAVGGSDYSTWVVAARVRGGTVLYLFPV